MLTSNRRFFYLNDLFDKYTNSTFPQNFNMIKPIFFTSYHATKQIDFVKYGNFQYEISQKVIV